MKNLQAIPHKLIAFATRYMVLIFAVLFGAMYGYLIYTSGQQANRQPETVSVNEQLQGASRPKLDATVAGQLMEFESRNIEVQALFDEARSNPFAE